MKNFVYIFKSTLAATVIKIMRKNSFWEWCYFPRQIQDNFIIITKKKTGIKTSLRSEAQKLWIIIGKNEQFHKKNIKLKRWQNLVRFIRENLGIDLAPKPISKS